MSRTTARDAIHVLSVVIESVVMTLFATAAVAGFKSSMWFVVVALAGHGVFDAGFDTARRLSIDRLRLGSGDRVLIVGAGTGLDLDFLPSNVHVTAIDVTPAMLKHLERRAAGTGRPVTVRIMDARRLAFPDPSFDAVVMHLILAVMPEPERGVREAVRVLKPTSLESCSDTASNSMKPS
jgi:ubiquinone/menaquinone biosynthesis C-methylase UbiE